MCQFLFYLLFPIGQCWSHREIPHIHSKKHYLVTGHPFWDPRSPCLCYGVHLNVSGELEGRNSVISLVNPLCWNGQREWLRTFMTNELLALRNGSILTGGENKLSKLCITGTKRETCLGKEKMLRKWENVSITAREASIGLNNMNNLVNIWKSILFGGAQKTD